MDVALAATPNSRSAAFPLAYWSKAFGRALSTLSSSTIFKHITIRGPGVLSSSSCHGPVAQRPPSSSAAAADASGTVLLSALRLPSLEVLQVYDIPWAAALNPLSAGTVGPSRSLPFPSLALHNLREVTMNRCFYSTEGQGDPVMDGSEGERWQALGRSLASLPHLERLDLAFTHAMTFCDPARGAVVAGWSPLVRLRHLSLAHDLSVQPPPPPPAVPQPQPTGAGPSLGGIPFAHPVTSSAASSEPAACANQPDCAHRMAEEARNASVEDAAAASSSTHGDGAPGGVPVGSSSHSRVGEARDSDGPGSTGGDAGLEAALAALAAVAQDGEYDSGDEADARDDSAVAWSLAPSVEDLTATLAAVGVAPEALLGADPPMLTVDAAHAAVELLTWLPTCTALTSLDLRSCGLEAVPMAVAHLHCLERLDLRGNPLVTLRLPGPLERLAWLAFSLDPCYDMLADMLAAEAGAAVAAEEMFTVELHAPRLEELEVDGSSVRALDLLRDAVVGLPRMRRLALTNTGIV